MPQMKLKPTFKKRKSTYDLGKIISLGSNTEIEV